MGPEKDKPLLSAPTSSDLSALPQTPYKAPYQLRQQPTKTAKAQNIKPEPTIQEDQISAATISKQIRNFGATIQQGNQIPNVPISNQNISPKTLIPENQIPNIPISYQYIQPKPTIQEVQIPNVPIPNQNINPKILIQENQAPGAPATNNSDSDVLPQILNCQSLPGFWEQYQTLVFDLTCDRLMIVERTNLHINLIRIPLPSLKAVKSGSVDLVSPCDTTDSNRTELIGHFDIDSLRLKEVRMKGEITECWVWGAGMRVIEAVLTDDKALTATLSIALDEGEQGNSLISEEEKDNSLISEEENGRVDPVKSGEEKAENDLVIK